MQSPISTSKACLVSNSISSRVTIIQRAPRILLMALFIIFNTFKFFHFRIELGSSLIQLNQRFPIVSRSLSDELHCFGDGYSRLARSPPTTFGRLRSFSHPYKFKETKRFN
ncbi:hypothetical protein EUGRSUZ_H03837 [Eucalyptus grandis]|uniref:Uncharacterized protein n=2 Tax=Eucalyptus grandis TaxID=71139 RepID=A0ACC3JV65_EUCGR|nr:hypothetical protein EUGRSUZ_H03837 [Eucalyptus grandis]